MSKLGWFPKGKLPQVWEYLEEYGAAETGAALEFYIVSLDKILHMMLCRMLLLCYVCTGRTCESIGLSHLLAAVFYWNWQPNFLFLTVYTVLVPTSSSFSTTTVVYPVSHKILEELEKLRWGGRNYSLSSHKVPLLFNSLPLINKEFYEIIIVSLIATVQVKG